MKTQAVPEPVREGRGVILRSLDRGLLVLELLGQHDEALSVSEVGSLLDTDKSTAHHILNTLRQRGYAEQDPVTRRYRLGVKLLHLGFQVSRKLDVIQTARPYLQALATATAGTAHVAKLVNGSVVYLDKVQAAGEHVFVASEAGQMASPHCTASGKVLLSYGSPLSQVDSVLADLPLPAMTANTITDHKAFKDHLVQVRKQGYSVDQEEFRTGVVCVGAPLFNHERRLVAAISCSWPESMARGKRLKPLITQVAEAAKRISAALGFEGSPAKSV